MLICSAIFAVLTVRARAARSDEGQKPRKVLKLDVITVEGRIQKPQAFYILQRSNLNFGELERTETFLPKIVQSVNHDPF
jgi:heterodisulfide reductase subunit C